MRIPLLLLPVAACWARTRLTSEDLVGVRGAEVQGKNPRNAGAVQSLYKESHIKPSHGPIKAGHKATELAVPSPVTLASQQIKSDPYSLSTQLGLLPGYGPPPLRDWGTQIWAGGEALATQQPSETQGQRPEQPATQVPTWARLAL